MRLYVFIKARHVMFKTTRFVMSSCAFRHFKAGMEGRPVVRRFMHMDHRSMFMQHNVAARMATNGSKPNALLNPCKAILRKRFANCKVFEGFADCEAILCTCIEDGLQSAKHSNSFAVE